MDKLVRPQNTIAVLKRHAFVMQKRFGQNFLIDEHVLGKILSAAELTPDDFVLEIGPGIGTMTQALAERAGRVTAVEIDRGLIPILRENLAEFDNVEILNADVLSLDLAALCAERGGGRPVKVVANLPYYITTPIIMELFEKNVPLSSAVLMVQREVAERMRAGKGTKDYGALSLAVQYYAEPEIVASVPPNCFLPRPKVGSCVIRLTRRPAPPVETSDPALLFGLIRAAFAQRRKTFYNSISNSSELHLEKEKVTAALVRLGLPPAVRGEALGLEEFAKLSDLLAASQQEGRDDEES